MDERANAERQRLPAEIARGLRLADELTALLAEQQGGDDDDDMEEEEEEEEDEVQEQEPERGQGQGAAGARGTAAANEALDAREAQRLMVSTLFRLQAHPVLLRVLPALPPYADDGAALARARRDHRRLYGPAWAAAGADPGNPAAPAIAIAIDDDDAPLLPPPPPAVWRAHARALAASPGTRRLWPCAPVVCAAAAAAAPPNDNDDDAPPPAPAARPPFLQGGLLAASAGATSRDHRDQAAANVLTDAPDRFWSSTGEALGGPGAVEANANANAANANAAADAPPPPVPSQARASEERLTFVLASCGGWGGAAVGSVSVRAYRAAFQPGHPVYPPLKIQVWVGVSLASLAPAGPWMPLFPSDAEQHFALASAAGAGAAGGQGARVLQLRLRGRPQWQLEDLKFYVALRHCGAAGALLPPSTPLPSPAARLAAAGNAAGCASEPRLPGPLRWAGPLEGGGGMGRRRRPGERRPPPRGSLSGAGSLVDRTEGGRGDGSGGGGDRGRALCFCRGRSAPPSYAEAPPPAALLEAALERRRSRRQQQQQQQEQPSPSSPPSPSPVPPPRRLLEVAPCDRPRGEGEDKGAAPPARVPPAGGAAGLATFGAAARAAPSARVPPAGGAAGLATFGAAAREHGFWLGGGGGGGGACACLERAYAEGAVAEARARAAMAAAETGRVERDAQGARGEPGSSGRRRPKSARPPPPPRRREGSEATGALVALVDPSLAPYWPSGRAPAPAPRRPRVVRVPLAALFRPVVVRGRGRGGEEDDDDDDEGDGGVDWFGTGAQEKAPIPA